LRINLSLIKQCYLLELLKFVALLLAYYDVDRENE